MATFQFWWNKKKIWSPYKFGLFLSLILYFLVIICFTKELFVTTFPLWFLMPVGTVFNIFGKSFLTCFHIPTVLQELSSFETFWKMLVILFQFLSEIILEICWSTFSKWFWAKVFRGFVASIFFIFFFLWKGGQGLSMSTKLKCHQNWKVTKVSQDFLVLSQDIQSLSLIALALLIKSWFVGISSVHLHSQTVWAWRLRKAVGGKGWMTDLIN